MNEGTPTLLEAKTSMIFKKKKRQAKTHAQWCVYLRACIYVCVYVFLGRFGRRGGLVKILPRVYTGAFKKLLSIYDPTSTSIM